MTRLLYIEASPRKKRSASIEVAKTFLSEYQKNHPHDEIYTIDLWQRELPRFDGDMIDAKYAIMHGQAHTEAQRKAWRAVEQTIAEFKSGDKYLFSLPMWNFTIPYVLKHYIDVIVQPSYTFSYSPDQGYQGLVVGKPAALIYARGGAYGPGSGGQDFDIQQRYMETILGFIGIKETKPIVVEPTEGKDAKSQALAKANEEAVKIAAHF
jgi:FMN-dependent NADH-azoreductase